MANAEPKQQQQAPLQDVYLVGYNEESFHLSLRTAQIKDSKTPKSTELRDTLKERYEGKAGKKYAIAFYQIGEKRLIVTDFFTAVLVDPRFYVKNLAEKTGVLCIVADEFALNELMPSPVWQKDTDIGLYGKLLEILNVFWSDVTDISSQATREYFDNHVNKE